MRCDICGGKLEKKLVSYTLKYKGKWIIVENVPATVCVQCGEQLFSPDVVEKLQNVIWNKKKPTKQIKTPIYDLSAA
jgi:YgiT-type zinc finger domain-containing protein